MTIQKVNRVYSVFGYKTHRMEHATFATHYHIIETDVLSYVLHGDGSIAEIMGTAQLKKNISKDGYNKYTVYSNYYKRR